MNQTVYGGYIDEHGNLIERTPHSHPYSYDGFVTYRDGENSETNMTLYSDRMLQQNYNKTRILLYEHFGDDGDYYSGRDPKVIEKFLRKWMDKPNLKLILVMQYCNQSTGYPVWRFDVNLDYKTT